MKVGVCTCSGALYKTTFDKAWARWNQGKFKNAEVLNPKEEVCQCEKCNKIYAVTEIEAQAVGLEQTSAKKQDFGETNGRA